MAGEQNLLELPALGLPFELGTLYNANKNQIIPALSLWEYEHTNVNVHKRCNSAHNTDVTATDSLESKMDCLDIRGNFIISALSNKLEVKGSGAFLKDKKTSKTQARIVLETRGTNKDEFISVNHFSKETLERHHEFIKKSGATHVVVRITYGYQLFLMLETTCESEEEKLKVQGRIEGKVSSHLQGEVEGSYKTKEETKLNELKVRIHGTVQIPSNPISLQEAIEIYKRIPGLAADKECPMKVHLLPLASICSSLPKVCNPINEAVLNSVTSIFEDISNSEVALSEIQTSDIAITEPRIRRRAKKLSTMLTEHKIWLQMKLYDIMSNPQMEKNSSESEQMLKVLKKHKNSPFSTETFGIYLSKMEKEVCLMKKLVRMFTFSNEDGSSGDGTNKNVGEVGKKAITIDILSDETDFLIPFERCKVFVLELPIITVEDDLLNEMQKYDPDNDNGFSLRQAAAMPLPVEEKELQTRIWNCATTFVNLAHSYNNDDGKSSAKFRCVFTGYTIDGKLTISEYNASTCDVETYFCDSLHPMSAFLGHKEQGKPTSFETSTADLLTTCYDIPSQIVPKLVAHYERNNSRIQTSDTATTEQRI